MAIYHFSAKVISRSSGSSAVAAAAYRAGEKIVDERTGKIYDYTRKTGVDSSWILAPELAPDWVFNREKLWNEVESVERRKDSQLAREINVALPTELDIAQQLELVREFVNEQFISEGMVADIACHDLDTHNPHAHIMLTMREIDEQGFSAKKNRDWNKKELLEKQREAWATNTNKALEIAGISQTIDHRSLEAQGESRIPQIHLGVAVNAMSQRGIVTEREEQYLEIKAANRNIRKHEFHLELIDRLESSYKNNPELNSEVESATLNQKQAIKPPEIQQIRTESSLSINHPKTAIEPGEQPNTEPQDQPRKSEHTSELKRLKQENASFVERMTRLNEQLEQDNIRLAEKIARFNQQLEPLKSDAVDAIPDQPERETEPRKYQQLEQPTSRSPATEPDKADSELKNNEKAEKIPEPLPEPERNQIFQIAAHFLRHLNSDVWDSEPESSKYDLITNRKNLLSIKAKDGRGEIVRFQNGKFQTQQLTRLDLEIFQRIDTSLMYRNQVANTAARFLHLTGRSTWNEGNGSRDYNLMTNPEGLLVIEAKDGRGEILRRQNGKVVTKGLTLKDVERFKQIDIGLDKKLEQVRSTQRNQVRSTKRDQGRGFSR